MDFKYQVGQSVEYKPVGRGVGLFSVVRQMPDEHTAVDRRYRIKSEHEGFERNVMECDLSERVLSPVSYINAQAFMR
jgi:hypothetical protein